MATIRPRVVADAVYKSQASYTIDIDLPTSGILSTLWLIARMQTEADGSYGAPFLRNLISSISLNQAGQNALNAARPNHFAADYYYKTGMMPRMGQRWMGDDGEIEEVVPILLGDHPRDLEHTIDLSKLSDPQLSVTYDTAGTDISGVSIWDEGEYPNFTVIADLIEGAGIPVSKGYQSLRQVETYNPANSEIHKLELKGERPIKTIYIQGDHPGCGYRMNQYVDKLRIHGENESWVPFSMTFERFKDYLQMLYGNCKVNYEQIDFKTDAVLDTVVEERLMTEIELKNTQTIQGYVYGGSGRNAATMMITMSTGAQTATPQWGYYHGVGLAPWSVYAIDFKKLMNMDYLDPTVHKPVYLELEHTSNAATTQPGPMRLAVLDLVKPQ